MTEKQRWEAVFDEEIANHLVAVEERIRGDTERFFEVCESPIERMMLAGLLFCPFGYYYHPPHMLHDSAWPNFPDARVVIVPQQQIVEYRADFAVFVRNFSDDTLRFAIECDGHDFHEKTKAQAARDKKRDRVFQFEGWPVFRFTGSEIFNDLDACINEIDAYVDNWMDEDLKRLGVIRGKK